MERSNARGAIVICSFRQLERVLVAGVKLKCRQSPKQNAALPISGIAASLTGNHRKREKR
jgi:hypothetical protein